VCSFSLEASTGHDTPGPGELPVVSLNKEGRLEPDVSLSLKNQGFRNIQAAWLMRRRIRED